MEMDLDLKVNLFKEYLDNGGVEKIYFKDLLDDLMKVKSLSDGKVDPSTVSSLVKAAMNAYVGGQLMEPFMSDVHLSEYETLLQKSIFFDQINIETEKEFDEVFDKFNSRHDILFRGLNDAKYRLYSSLQRHWINSKLYEKHKSYAEFLKTLVDTARQEQNTLLVKFLETMGFDPDNDLAVLSFLQHYSCPTPLLDWTYSFSNALYFATENIKMPTTTWEIDKYFCVYFLEEKYISENSIKENVETFLSENFAPFKEGLFTRMTAKGFSKEQFDKVFTDAHITDMFVRSKARGAITYMTKMERLTTFPLLYFSDFKKDSIKGLRVRYFLNNNMNIVNQQGVFTWNPHPTKPLEHIANEMNNTEKPNSRYRFSECININKNLSEYVKQKLTKLNVTKDFIYPDPYKIARQTFDKTK